jgi:membrane-associated phospholipid phosphatase
VIRTRPPRVNVGEAAAVIIGAALLAASWVVVAITERVPSWEVRTFEAVNGLPAALWPVMWIPMQLGSFLGSLVVVGVTAVVSRNTRLTLAALLGSQTAFWAAKGIKRLARRGRPEALLSDVQLREHAGGLGYISGHAAVAFALLAVLVPSLPSRWQPVVAVVAVTVGVARVYAGVHLPLDVVGGCGFGLLCGTFARWTFGLGGEGLPPRPGVEA